MPAGDRDTRLSLTAARPAKPAEPPLRTSGKKRHPWECRNRFPLTCIAHPDHGEVSVPCGRWRECGGCARRLSWRLRQRYLAGIEQVPPGKHALFVTLTFPAERAPTEAEAHRAWRSLVRRLRYRGYLGATGWCLQRTRAGTLHYHCIWHSAWLDLEEFRALLVASGFGPMHRVVEAQPEHAGYIVRYISTRLADLAPLKRAYSFSRSFPLSAFEAERRRVAEVGEPIGLAPVCAWVPSYELRA